MLLFLVAATNGALAELPQRIRTLKYEPVATQRPDAPQRHFANRPAPEPQTSSPASQSSAARRDSGGRTSRTPEEVVTTTLPEPIGQIDDPQMRKWFIDFNQKIVAAKSGESPSRNNNTQESPIAGSDSSTTSATGANAGPIVATRIFQDPATNDWYARIEGSSRPLELSRQGDRFFHVDDLGNKNEVIVWNDDSTVAPESTKDGAKSSLADDQTRNAVMLIVTVMAVLAALGIGMLAFDYKYRWEQEIVSQNNRLLGNGATAGTFTELDSLEPETLRFSPHDYGSLDDSFDHSFRTIA